MTSLAGTLESVGELADGHTLGDGDGVAADGQVGVRGSLVVRGLLDLGADRLLVLLLLAAALGRGGGDRRLGLVEDLLALELLGLDRHLAVAVLFVLVERRRPLRPRGGRARRRWRPRATARPVGAAASGRGTRLRGCWLLGNRGLQPPRARPAAAGAGAGATGGCDAAAGAAARDGRKPRVRPLPRRATLGLLGAGALLLVAAAALLLLGLAALILGGLALGLLGGALGGLGGLALGASPRQAAPGARRSPGRAALRILST